MMFIKNNLLKLKRNFKYKSGAGFTVFEIIVVLAILSILSVIVVANFVLQKQQTDLKNGVKEVAAVFRLAQNKTLSSLDNSQYGVYLDASVSPNRYILFKGSSYATRDVAYDLIYYLPSTVQFSNINLNGGNQQVVFDKLAGTTGNAGSFTISPLGINQGLIRYWKFDESSGNVAVDSSGSGNNGTYSGTGANPSVPAVSFYDPYSRKFNRQSNHYIDLGTPSTGLNSYSISFWVNLNSVPELNFPREVLGWGLGFSGPYLGFLDYNNGSNHTLSVSFNLTSINADSIISGAWNHVVLVVDSASTKFYLNGSLIGSRPTTPITPPPAGPNLKAGYFSGDPNHSSFDGSMDDFRFYNRALSDAEVSLLDNVSTIYVPGSGTISFSNPALNYNALGLVAAWNFDDDPANTSAIDSSGSGRIGIYQGTSQDVSVPPVTYSDPYSRKFNGASDYVDFGSTPGMLGSAMSFAGWVKPNILNDMFIFHKGYASLYVLFSLTNTGQLYCGIYKDGISYYATDNVPTVTVGSWVYVACVIDPSQTGGNTIKLYKNGLEITNKSFNPWNGTLNLDNQPVVNTYVGRNVYYAAPQYYFNGNIDEFRVYNRSLSQGEVQSNMDTPLSRLLDIGRSKDSRHAHFDYNRSINTATEIITLSFDGGLTTYSFPISAYMVSGQIEWLGTVCVGGTGPSCTGGSNQTIEVHTHHLNDLSYANKTQFSIHRNRKLNNKGLAITISGDSSGNIVSYSADGLITNYSSIYTSNLTWQ